MHLKRRLVPAKSTWSTPVIATVTSIAVVAAAAVGGQPLIQTQEAGSGPIEVSSASETFGSGETVVVDDPAIAAQGEGEGPRAVKQFHRDETFSSFAVTWKGTRDVAAFVRAKQPDGSWSEWYDMDSMSYNNDDPNATNGTELIFVGDTNDVQVSINNVDLVTGSNLDEKLTESPVEDAALDDAPFNVGDIAPVAETEELPANSDVEGLEAVFMDGNAQEGEGIEPTAETDGMPRVVSRAGWGADESIRCKDADYDDGVKAIALHHTAGSNNYTRAQAAAQVRAAYQYHAQNLGWCDIGYNALVDKYGTIYEGRYGGLAKAVQGAHIGGFNKNTWGISMIGNYETAQPTDALLESVTDLAGWKGAISGVDPTSRVSLRSEGFGGSRYPAGASASVYGLFGHSDVHFTACPGKYTIAQWPTIRQAAHKKYLAIKSGASGSTSTDWGSVDTPTPDTSTPGGQAAPAQEATSSLGGAEIPMSTVTALVGLAGTLFAIMYARSDQQIDMDQTVNGLPVEQIPGIVTKVLSLSKNEGLKETWTAVLNAFGPALGLAVGGPDESAGIIYQLFQNGIVLGSEDTGTHALVGRIAKEWASGDNAATLGLPTSNEVPTGLGKEVRVQFQGGSIVYNPETEQIQVFTD
ncbi:N-acetylmuramoyl-L-alanine amidase [Corynebacterium aurimucosum]|uniref:N-acetylmuramoyl-L-alanine amidase n=1 Tax=Corynebacterium aurimucosum TaxID=169292 RepID=UPI00187B1061|nr:N-acetylmuramoyl-L-alanine amidase [Corynebacterium aurimucosum]MBE7365726.1 N-acetylmuramoyl-L-alanine amidase [Corynebacterium aurimucosum]